MNSIEDALDDYEEEDLHRARCEERDKPGIHPMLLDEEFERAGKYFAQNNSREYHKWVTVKAQTKAMNELKAVLSEFNANINKLLK